MRTLEHGGIGEKERAGVGRGDAEERREGRQCGRAECRCRDGGDGAAVGVGANAGL